MKGHPKAEATSEPKFIAELHGRVALVTGASRGIGRAIALALAKAGADVAVNYHTHAEEAHAACSEIESLGRRAVAVQANVAIATDVARMVETVQERLGGTDILVNNAGISRPQPLSDITEQDWDEVVAVNLKSITGQTINVNGGWYMS